MFNYYMSNALFLIYRVCYERLVEKSAYRECDLGSTDDYDKVAFYTHQSKVLDNACGKCYYLCICQYRLYHICMCQYRLYHISQRIFIFSCIYLYLIISQYIDRYYCMSSCSLQFSRDKC